EIIVNKTGITINGINIIGFNTIGNPNITGSLILKILPGAETFAISRYGCFLSLRITMKIAINKEMVAPDPPRNTNESKNGFVTILGTSYADTPALNKSPFSITNGIYIGSIIAPRMLVPCKPKNHNRWFKKATMSAAGNVLLNPCKGSLMVSKTSSKILESENAFIKAWIKPTRTKMIIVGISALKDFSTPAGTPSGILIVNLDWMNIRNNSAT